jgi:prolipoprotein diacylglyceryl transferase
MPAAYLPSPASSVWHLGAIPVRAYALCMVVGVVAGLWLTDRRYRKAGYRPGVILDLATVAVPVGLVGARVYAVLTDAGQYFGRGRDWTDVFRVWDGGMGVAGAVAAGALAAFVYCRRKDVEIGPVALAAVPALALAQALSVWGNWFSQSLYGRPSGLPWAVEIAPQHRVAGFQSFATFQPLFLYESLFDVLLAVLVAYAIHRFLLSGGIAFALYGALWAAGGATIEMLRLDYSPRLFGMRANTLAMLVIFGLACSYLIAMRRKRLLRLALLGAEPASRPQALRPRSTRAASAEIGFAAPAEIGFAAPAEEADPPPGPAPRRLQH